jgi:hypothetical protein
VPETLLRQIVNPSSFNKPVHVATSGFHKPFCDGTIGLRKMGIISNFLGGDLDFLKYFRNWEKKKCKNISGFSEKT